jgi:hypothetical protein
MSDQTVDLPRPALVNPGDPFEVRALAFHDRNPHVLRAIVDVSLRLRRAKRPRLRWSIAAAFEVVRYNADISTDGRTYKLNNNHKAFYARWIMRDVPELEGFFKTRTEKRVRQYDDD